MKNTSHQLKFQSVTSQIREHVEAQLRGAVLSTIYELLNKRSISSAVQGLRARATNLLTERVLIPAAYWRKVNDCR